MLKVVIIAGDFVAEAVWHRVVILVVNTSDIHEYAAERMLETVKSKYAHENAVALAGYLLGEIGVNICERPAASGYEQFAALHQHFALMSPKTQALMFTTYIKLVNLYPDTKDVVTEVFAKYATSAILELQQRACEYMQLPTVGAEVMETVSILCMETAHDYFTTQMHKILGK